MATDRFVLFDFDGVIADSYELANRIAQQVCVHLIPEVHRKGFEHNINTWHNEWIQQVHGPECNHGLDYYAAYSEAREKEPMEPFPGMVDSIRTLAKAYRFAIISSSTTDHIHLFLKERGIDELFLDVMGSDTHALKTHKIRMVFEKYGVAGDECVFITDTLGDMREAAAAGVGAIGVSWGFNDVETLAKGKPFCIVEKPEDIPGVVADYFARE